MAWRIVAGRVGSETTRPPSALTEAVEFPESNPLRRVGEGLSSEQNPGPEPPVWSSCLRSLVNRPTAALLLRLPHAKCYPRAAHGCENPQRSRLGACDCRYRRVNEGRFRKRDLRIAEIPDAFELG